MARGALRAVDQQRGPLAQRSQRAARKQPERGCTRTHPDQIAVTEAATRSSGSPSAKRRTNPGEARCNPSRTSGRAARRSSSRDQRGVDPTPPTATGGSQHEEAARCQRRVHPSLLLRGFADELPGNQLCVVTARGKATVAADSTTRPASITTMRSASITVASRCAITMTVHRARRCSRAPRPR